MTSAHMDFETKDSEVTNLSGGALLAGLEKHQIAQQLHRSEAYLAEAQSLSRTGSFGWKVNSGELVWSAETYAILGFDLSQQPSLEAVFARVHPQDLEHVQRCIADSVANKADYDFQCRLVMPNGDVKELHVRARAVNTSFDELEFIGAVMDITEHKRAVEALRLSERVAKSQLEALANSLAALSKESIPDKFLEHVFRISCEQLRAVSSSIWQMNDDVGCVDLVAIYENGVLRLPMNSEGLAPPKLKYDTEDHPVWAEFFRTGKHCVFGTIESGPPWSMVAINQNGPWYEWKADLVDNPIVGQIIEDIAARGIVATLNVPMFVGTKVSGLFVLCFKEKHLFERDEIELTRAMSYQAMLALQLMRLFRQTSETAIIAERNRMARDIHDTLAQGLTGIIVQLEAAKAAAGQHDKLGITTHIERASELARSSLGEARRSVRALRPRQFGQGPLGIAINDLLRSICDNTGLQVHFHLEGENRLLPSNWNEELLRISQEALTNAIKHANATSFQVVLKFESDLVQLQLADNGIGFDTSVQYEGFGIVGMKERVERMNGRFSICSKLGSGTEIQVSLTESTHSQSTAPIFTSKYSPVTT
jgi:signal transduction histidine kinase